MSSTFGCTTRSSDGCSSSASAFPAALLRCVCRAWGHQRQVSEGFVNGKGAGRRAACAFRPAAAGQPRLSRLARPGRLPAAARRAAARSRPAGSRRRRPLLRAARVCERDGPLVRLRRRHVRERDVREEVAEEDLGVGLHDGLWGQDGQELRRVEVGKGRHSGRRAVPNITPAPPPLLLHERRPGDASEHSVGRRPCLRDVVLREEQGAGPLPPTAAALWRLLEPWRASLDGRRLPPACDAGGDVASSGLHKWRRWVQVSQIYERWWWCCRVQVCR